MNNAEYKPTKVIATYTNAELGIEAVVAEITGGVSVALRDTDADEAIGCFVYPAENFPGAAGIAAATAKAKALLAGRAA